MKRIRQEFDLADDSWDRIAESVGKESPLRKRAEPLAEDHVSAPTTPTEDPEADEAAQLILEQIYTELGGLPQAWGPIVLKRIVQDLTLQPDYRYVTARGARAKR